MNLVSFLMIIRYTEMNNMINSLDILIDVELLEKQYRFLLSKYQQDWWTYEAEQMKMPDQDLEHWEGILNLFETVLDKYLPLDNPRSIVIG